MPSKPIIPDDVVGRTAAALVIATHRRGTFEEMARKVLEASGYPAEVELLEQDQAELVDRLNDVSVALVVCELALKQEDR